MANLYKNEEITKSRVNVFLGWENFNAKGNVAPGRMDQNMCGRLWTCRKRDFLKVSVTALSTPLTNATREKLESFQFSPTAVGKSFGPTFASHLFRLDIAVPSEFSKLPVHLLWDSNTEAMVLSEDGLPVQGLVGGDHWARRVDYRLCPQDQDPHAGRSITLRLYVEISCNGLFGAGRGGDIEPPDMVRTYKLEECCISVFDPSAWALIHDVTLLQGLSKHLPDVPRRAQALHVANAVINAVTVQDRSTYAEGRRIAARYLTAPNGASQCRVTAMLHSHIDLAWLWPMAATPAKGARTFATVLRLLDQYPDAIFVQSQAQLYAWVKQRYPLLWASLLPKVKSGRFVPVGSTWVEMDCNLPSGESLVRQFVYGQGFFKDNFGKHCIEFFLPDTFGYAAQLPQIMKKCGVDYFLTQKLSWNIFNKFPHSSFIWEGLDGSRVLTHMPPADTYNSQAFPEEIIRSAHKNKDATVFNQSILLVGHGDGGGGPSPAMLESLQRMKDVDGVPKVSFGTPDQFFAEMKEQARDLPRWVGELYFELHRGTYTSQANVKKCNRRCEHGLREVEMISSLAAIRANGNFEYPRGALDQAWKRLLTTHFHDTLPGSCIGMVYKETERDFKFVQDTCDALRARAWDSLKKKHLPTVEPAVKKQKAGTGSEQIKKHGALSTRSLMALDRSPLTSSSGSDLRVISVKMAYLQGNDANRFVQEEYRGNGVLEKDSACGLIAVYGMPRGFGIGRIPHPESLDELRRSSGVTLRENFGPDKQFMLRNSRVNVLISRGGKVTSMRLKDSDFEREVFSGSGENGGFGNRLVLYDDVPMFWCAWDIEVYADEKCVEIGDAVEVKVVEEGPIRTTLHFKYALTEGGSQIEQYVSLFAGSSRLDFNTSVDWQESRKVLRVLFDTDVRAGMASYDSQFGFVQRPTTRNHSWEVAKFEVVGHRFCDLSEHGFGIALMSDCKYGYSVRDGLMRLSLLRAPKSPDDEADMGPHQFKYAVMPHFGAFPNCAVVNEAADLNEGVTVETRSMDMSECGFGGDIPPWKFSVVSGPNGGMEHGATQVECVGFSCFKQAERRDGRFVLRVYEAFGSRGRAKIQIPFGLSIVEARGCNMLEDMHAVGVKQPYDIEINKFTLEFSPFEVVTVMLRLGGLQCSTAI